MFDFRACDVSGATPAALEAFERALAALNSGAAVPKDSSSLRCRVSSLNGAS